MNLGVVLKLVFLCMVICLTSTCEDKSKDLPEGKQGVNSDDMDNHKTEWAIVIHGGAGTIVKENMNAELEEAYRTALNNSLDKAMKILSEGGDAGDAVIAAITLMEDSPLFNAGKGSVFTHEGKNEMDASIMRGYDLEAGAVAGITTVKNPILAARAVMEHSPHVMLSGKGAEEFAGQQGLEIVDPGYFHTDNRWKSLQNILEKEKDLGYDISAMADSKYGTVGAVALDTKGNIVAGTSTGGMTNKRFNRIGDSPVIGAGTYANNKTCGVSCTGHGEYFIRYAVAHDLSALMEYKGLSLEEAGDEIIHGKLKEAGGSGGLIALDKNGNIIMPFNTPGMYRGYATDENREVLFYK